jgi:hypothetical protein
MRQGRWHAWRFRDARELTVAEDARVVCVFGTLAAVTCAGDRCTLHVGHADRAERFALDGDVDVIRFTTRTADNRLHTPDVSA